MSNPEILFFGTGEVPRRNLHRLLDAFFEGDTFDPEQPLTALFFADADWSGTTDVAFDYALESDRFDTTIVLAPAEDVHDEKLVEDLVADGAVVENYADIFEGVLSRSEFTHAVCFFDEEDDDLAEDVMALVEDGREVYDAVGGMLKFDVAVEEPDEFSEEETVEDDASDDSADADASADEADDDSEMNPKVKQAMDVLAEALALNADADAKGLAKTLGRGTMTRLMNHMGIEVYKGMHTTTMVDEALDVIADMMDPVAAADADESVDEVEVEVEVAPEPSEESREVLADAAEAVAEVAAVVADAATEVAKGAEQVETETRTRMAMYVSFTDVVRLLEVYDGDITKAKLAAAAFGVAFNDVDVEV